MLKIDAILVINTQTADHNKIPELTAALQEAGLEICEVDEQAGTIRICGNHLQMDEIRFFDGIDYIRPVMHYHSDLATVALECEGED